MTIQPLDDERLAEIKKTARHVTEQHGEGINVYVPVRASDLISLLARLDKAEAGLEGAYIRGATWSLEMGMHYKIEELRKAARDYADKATSPPSPRRSLR